MSRKSHTELETTDISTASAPYNGNRTHWSHLEIIWNISLIQWIQPNQFEDLSPHKHRFIVLLGSNGRSKRPNLKKKHKLLSYLIKQNQTTRLN